jgi:hypothetical protein
VISQTIYRRGQRKSRDNSLLPIWVFLGCSRVNFTFTFSFNNNHNYNGTISNYYGGFQGRIILLKFPIGSPNIILPVLLYGCETWSLILREERRLRVF